MNIFQKVINEEIELSKTEIFEESVEEKSIDIDIPESEYITEAVYPEALPYMKALPRKVILPKGSPVGKGCLCFLYTKTTNQSIKLMNTTGNFKNGNKYYLYFFNQYYRGSLANRVYRYNLLNQRKLLYKKIQKETKLKPYVKFSISNNENRNMYYDLSKYLEIFYQMCSKYPPRKKMTMYWDYMKGIFDETKNSKYQNRFVLVDLNMFELKKKLQDNLKNPLYLIYYTVYRFPELVNELDIDFYFFTESKALKINPSQFIENDWRKLRNEMSKMFGTVKHDELNNILNEDTIKTDEAVEEATDKIVNNLIGKEKSDNQVIGNEQENKTEILDGTKNREEKLSEIKSEIEISPIEKAIREKVETVRKEFDVKDIKTAETETISEKDLADSIQEIAVNQINEDKQLLEKIYNETSRRIVPTQPILSERDRKLKENQKQLNIHGITVEKLQKIQTSDVVIPEDHVDRVVKTPNENMKHIRYKNLNKVYNEKVMPKDIINSVLSLNEKSIPMYVRDVKVEDSSDELNYKETYTFYMEDANRQRHTIKVDIPKFLDDKFIYIGGNKKIIKNQEFLYPVVKTDEDTVYIVTNYNKMRIQRVDTKSVSSIERLKKLLKSDEKLGNYFTFGNAFSGNKDFITTIEYDELSKLFMNFISPTIQIWFNMNTAKEYAKTRKIIIPSGSIFIGLDSEKNPIFVDTETQLTLKGGKSIVDLIVENISEDLQENFTHTRIPKRLMYAKVTVMAQSISLSTLLCFWEGLTTILKKINLNYELVDKLPKEMNVNESYIQFSDCYMIYKENIAQSLLLNGLRMIDTTMWKITDMDTQEPYLRYFIKVYGNATIANALMNFYEFTIDPITEEVLTNINLPTDLVELIIYATNLLSDSQFTPEINQKLSRIRSNEIIPAILYESIAKGYVPYRNSNGKKKFSIQQDIVIKKLLAIKTVEEYSTLNPVLEMEMTHSVSTKGFRGVNLAESYTVPKRCYDPTMTGVIGVGTSPDANVGIMKTLTLEPSITSIRGYVDVKNDRLDELKDVNLFSPGELSIPLGAFKDDPTRLGHAIKQSKHVIPVKESSPVLISNGFEEISRFHLSSDFVVNADEDGEVIEKDENTGVMIVKYKSGKFRAVNLDDFIVKNGGGGFYLSNKLITKLNVGDKFKKHEPLAYHEKYFTNDRFNNCKTNMGTLAKVAFMTSYNTYEDATFISKRLSDAASTEMTFLTKVVIGKNSNLLYLIKKGQRINVGEPLIQFDTSYEDSELNELLIALGDDAEGKKMLSDGSKNNIKSKYSGIVEKITIYSTVDLDELSPSLRKAVKSQYDHVKKRNTILEKYDPESKNSIVKCGILCADTTKKVVPNKYGVIDGEHVEDAVMIKIFIKHSEPLEVGSKIANYTGVKNTIGEIPPDGYEPFSSFREDEPIDTYIASNSILSRKVPTIIETGLGNKLIVELKRKLSDIYFS